MWDHAYRILFGTTFRTVRTLFLLVGALHLLYFVVLPHLLTRRKTKSPALRRYLEFVVATPSLLGDVIRMEARHDLMRLAHMEGRHDQAAEQGFAILRHKQVPSGMAVEVRGRLADALDGLGRHEEAAAHRGQAETALVDSPRDVAWYIHRGRQLQAKRDFAGACRAFEEGLDAAPAGNKDARALLALSLANALFMAGRMEESAARAEETTGLVSDPERLLLAHRQAGSSFADLGRLDESEAHKRRAVEIAETLGDPTRLVDCLADLAEMHRKRGRLAEALAACDRAGEAARPTRHLELIRYEILKSWGRFDDALAAQERAAKLDPNPTPRAEQLIQGLFAFGRATTLMEKGSLDGVARQLEKAKAGVRGDAKLTLWCDAAAMRLAALQGRQEEARAALDEIEGRLAGYVQDRNTGAGVLGNLGRTCLLLGEYERSIEHWEDYIDLPPKPVDMPTGHFHLGEAYRGLGDEASARENYRAAADAGIDTHYARLARSRLRTLAT